MGGGTGEIGCQRGEIERRLTEEQEGESNLESPDKLGDVGAEVQLGMTRK